MRHARPAAISSSRNLLRIRSSTPVRRSLGARVPAEERDGHREEEALETEGPPSDARPAPSPRRPPRSARRRQAAVERNAPAADVKRRRRLEGAPPAASPPRQWRSVSGRPTVRAKYVYCMIRSAEPRRFGAIGLGGEPTRSRPSASRRSPPHLGHPGRGAGHDARERPRPRAGQREGDEELHGDSDAFGTMFRTCEDIVEFLRGSETPSGRLRQDAGQVGSASRSCRTGRHDRRDRERRRGHPAAQNRSRPSRARPTSPACSTAGRSTSPSSCGPISTHSTSSRSCGTSPWPPAPTSPSATR